MNRLLGGFCCMMIAAGDAIACTLQPTDLSESLSAAFERSKIGVYNSVDAQSLEPTRRYTVSVQGEGTLAVAQQHCEMHNLEVTFFPDSPARTEPRFDLMLKALASTPTWQTYFAHIDVEAVIKALRALPSDHGGATLNIDDVIWSDRAASEALIEWWSAGDENDSGKRVPVFYLGVGGL